MDFLIIFFFLKKRKKEKHFNKVESQHKEEQQRTQVLHLLEVIKLHQESIKQINTVKKKNVNGYMEMEAIFSLQLLFQKE